MTRNTAKVIRDEVELAIAKIAKKYKLTLELGSGTFTTSDFAVRVKMVDSDVAANKAAVTKPAKKATPPMGLIVEQMAVQLGLPRDVVGTKFKHKTKTFTVTSLTPSRPKNSVSLEDQNGKKFKCSALQLKAMLAR